MTILNVFTFFSFFFFLNNFFLILFTFPSLYHFPSLSGRINLFCKCHNYTVSSNLFRLKTKFKNGFPHFAIWYWLLSTFYPFVLHLVSVIQCLFYLLKTGKTSCILMFAYVTFLYFFLTWRWQNFPSLHPKSFWLLMKNDIHYFLSFWKESKFLKSEKQYLQKPCLTKNSFLAFFEKNCYVWKKTTFKTPLLYSQAQIIKGRESDFL